MKLPMQSAPVNRKIIVPQMSQLVQAQNSIQSMEWSEEEKEWKCSWADYECNHHRIPNEHACYLYAHNQCWKYSNLS